MQIGDFDSLSKKDQAFLRNLADQNWRLNNLYTIVDKSGKVVPFRPNWAQQQILDELTPRHLIPKGRQFGISTLLGILQLDSCLFYENFSALTICHNLEDAEKLFWRNIKGVYDRLPEWLREMVPASRDRARDIRFGNGSLVSVATSGRSGAYNLIHISEFGKICAKYPDKAREIVTGTFEAAGKDQIVAVESTAEGGAYGYFYDYCMDAKRAQDEGRKLTEMDWRMSFLPWYKHPEYVSSPMHVTLPEELVEYFERLAAERDITLSPARKAWYYGKWKTLGEDIKQEYPCIVGDVPIFTPSGIIRMDQARPDGDKIQAFKDNGTKPCVEVKTRLGYVVRCTFDHRILTPEGFVEAQNLAVGGRVRIGNWCQPASEQQRIVYRDVPCVESTITVDDDFAEFLGFFVGDGSYHANTLSFVCDKKDQDVVDRVSELCSRFVGKPSTRLVGSKKGGVEVRIGAVRMQSPLRQIGVIKTRDSGGIIRDVVVPDAIKSSPISAIKSFLRGLFEADGFAQRDGTGVKLHSKNEQFLIDVQLLLLRLGITSRRSSHVKKSGSGGDYVGHELSLRTNEAIAFGKQVGFVSRRKMDRVMAKNDGKRGGVKKRLPIAREDSVASISPIGDHPVYDIQTPDQRFSAGGIIVHNCYLEEAFEAAIKGAYYQKEMTEMRKEGRICSVPHYRGIAVNTWWDLGMDDAMAIWFVQEVGREMHLIHYEEHSGETMDFYARLLRDLSEERGFVYGFHIAPHDIEVRELGAGSRWESAARLGIKFVVAPKLDPVDGIEAVRNDMSRWWIDSKNCEHGIKALDSYQKEWDERRGTFKKTPLHNWASHAADGARTGVTGQINTYRARAVPVRRVRSWGA